jgi:hypothetical protein
MKIRELIDKIKEDENLNLETTLEIRTYIPIMVKRNIINNIILSSVSYENGFVQFDSVAAEVHFDVAMAKYHTNIEFGDSIEENYDMLKDYVLSGANLQTLITSLYRKDYDECYEMLMLSVQDLKEQYTVEATVARVANKISDALDNLIGVFANQAENMDLSKILPEGVDVEDVASLIKKYVK